MFNANDIAVLDYDFSGFYPDGPKGIVPEPSTEAISAYQLAISNLMDTAEERVEVFLDKPDETPGTGPVSVPRLDEEYGGTQTLSEQEKNAEIDKVNQETWAQRKMLLANLCQQQPSLDEINKLGHRVFLKFEEYVLGKWTPQAGSAATS
jgi:hypothetical protein